jgi:hypothetical protein
MYNDVRGDPSAIDAAWMTDALEEAGVARGANVTHLNCAGFIGTGQMSRNARFHLEWDQPHRPSSVVGKFPSTDPPTKASSFENGAYLSEFGFYTEIASTVDVRTPTCWVARYDDQIPDFVLIMEDLAGSVQGDQFTGSTVDETELAIEQAVGLHAPRWGDRSLADIVALQPSGGERAELVGQYYRQCVSPCLERLGHRFDADVTALLEDFAELVSPWTLGPGTPQTVVHGDFRPDNFLLGRGPDAPPIAVVDWQTVHLGLGPCDIAYLIGGAFTPEQRAGVERDFVAQYANRLTASGVPYHADDAWRDYRWGTLHGVLIAVLATVMAEQTERGDDMLTLMAIRHAQHAVDLDALDLVRSRGGAESPSGLGIV